MATIANEREPMSDTVTDETQAQEHTTDDVLTVRGVRKTYEAEGAPVRALRGADLTMRRVSSWR
jgi:hypothetical protein